MSPGIALDRVCREVERLVREFPDRLTLASTGGPVTGRDEEDRAAWQSNTRRLEGAGAMGVEYSLSCPQGGDGTQGDLVSQNAALTAKIVEWILESGDANVPKLFKLTSAVTAIRPILHAVRDVFARHAGKKAGVTLANSFPSLALRRAPGRKWDEGLVIGMSGSAVLPISNLTLAKVADMGVYVSGNGGAITYRDAANFMALGAQSVQFCTAVMKFGLGYVDELHSGLSFLLAERGLNSVADLIGAALPTPNHGFWGTITREKTSEGLQRTLHPLRKLHALPLPGSRVRWARRALVRRSSMRRLLPLRTKMLCRCALDDRANTRGARRALRGLNRDRHGRRTAR